MKANIYTAYELSGSGVWTEYESKFQIKDTAKSITIIPLLPSSNDYISGKTILRKNRNNRSLSIYAISETLVVVYRKDVGSPIRFVK